MLAFVQKGLETLKKSIEEGRLAVGGDRHEIATRPAKAADVPIARGATKKSKRRSGGSDAGRAAKVPRPAPVAKPKVGARVYIMRANLREGFIVLTNDGRESGSIGGWTLRSGATGSVVYKLPEGTAIEARTALVLLAPGGETPEAFKHDYVKELRSSRAWPDALLLHDADGTVVDGEVDINSASSTPYGALVGRAENYYRELVSQLVSQRLFAKSPGMVGPSNVSAESVRFTYDTRTHMITLVEQFAAHLVHACATEDSADATAVAVCSAVEDALPACDVQRRAVAEVARSAEHTQLFLMNDADAQKVADARYTADADAPRLTWEGVHALAVAIDYFLVELIETVATIAYAETTNPSAQGDAHKHTSDFCFGALDRLSLQMAIRMDPDLNKICAAVDSRPARVSTS